MNEFSIVCRLLGTLFQRAPSDAAILAPIIITMIAEDKAKPIMAIRAR